MKILYYNWVDYLDDENRGGGVTVYQRNLMRALKDETQIDPWFISSGISYDMFSNAPRWDKVRHGPSENRSRRFEIINSGVLSPSQHSFGSDHQIGHELTEAAFFDFIRVHGPFDVVHFNNLEGIPAKVLELKRQWPETRVVFSLHNYYPFCPQVNLWFGEKESCTDFQNGRKCVNCIPHRVDARIVRLADTVAFNLKKKGIRPGTRLFDRAFGPALRGARKLIKIYMGLFRSKSIIDLVSVENDSNSTGPLQPLKSQPRRFFDRRKDFVELINQNCDQVLCVSDQVAKIALQYGVSETLLRTANIGTNQAKEFYTTAPRASILRADGTLSLGYLGYMRRDKGFYFLLDTLESLPVETTQRLHLVFAAKNVDSGAVHRLRSLSETFASVCYADGYTHETLDELTAKIDVGVVPVLWEDNMPQVAIEMHARHIPLLTSNLGGAQELGACSKMVFDPSSRYSFIGCIHALLAGQITSESYWAGNVLVPITMEQHIDRLYEIYGINTSPKETEEDIGSHLEVGEDEYDVADHDSDPHSEWDYARNTDEEPADSEPADLPKNLAAEINA